MPGEPGFQDSLDRGDERRPPFLASLADGVNVGACGKDDVLAGQGGELGYPEPCLDGEGEQGVVPPAGPGPLVAGGEQSVGLLAGEVGDDVALGALRGDRQDPLRGRGVLGVLQGDVAEQRVDGGDRLLRVAGLLPRSLSRWARKADTSGASRSSMPSWLGVLPLRAEAKASSSQNVCL
jgi:hypothetical protein